MQADRRTRALQVCTCTDRFCELEVLRAVCEIGNNIKQWDCRRLLSNPGTKRTEGGIIGDPVFKMPDVLNRMIEVVVILVGDLMWSVKPIARAFHAVILMSPPFVKHANSHKNHSPHYRSYPSFSPPLIPVR